MRPMLLMEGCKKGCVAVPLEEDLKIIAEQERLLQFPHFNADVAWALGSRLRQMAIGNPKPIAIAIWFGGGMVFYAGTVGISPGNAEWLRRKKNTVERFAKSSLAVGLGLEREKTTLEARQGITLAEYAVHGGGFPIMLRGSGCVGAVVVSGLTQREDHIMATDAVAAMLGIEIPQIAVE